ncbi:amidohydrolase [Dokdonia sinensis]|uniref:Amidohydrolase n=1 Tax=Dokdonia sinensis TaxID=2479847 RepID=A0A3M0G4J9_9FLAO|nr:amidohydrolase family protein [Dokdonia sinensis]RMB56089.1 amidohydrolase [Dokdonia sinensis]
MRSIIYIILFAGFGLQAQESFVITNVTVFDGEKVLENQNITVASGKIIAIGQDELTTETTVDGTGKFVMPALTNSHVHVFNVLGLAQAAQAGVLNVFDMHGMETLQGVLKEQRDNPKLATLYNAGFAATAAGGHGTQFGFPVPTLEKPEDADQWVTDRVAAGVDYIKIIVEPWKNTISHETAKAIIEETHINDKVAVVHISKAEDAHQVFLNGADGLVHLWWDNQMTEAQMEAITARENIFVIPTVLTTVLMQELFMGKSKEEAGELKNMMLTEIKRLHDAGITILAGTDPPNANINMGTDLYKELAYLSEAGIPNLEVLKSATSYPMDKFRIANKGYLKKGYVADMLLLSKNPIDDIKNMESIEMIWKNGVLLTK